MRHASDVQLVESDAGTDRTRSLVRELAHAHRPRGPQGGKHTREMRIAHAQQLAAFARLDLVGREVCATLGHEHERTVITHEGPGKELLGRAIATLPQTPEARSTDLAARARKARDRPLWML